MSSPKITQEDANALLNVFEPIPVAWTSKDGTERDDDGEAIDPRQLSPWCWALGPFGSWPETEETARERIREEEDWRNHKNFRLGTVITWKPGWGYQAKESTDE